MNSDWSNNAGKTGLAAHEAHAWAIPLIVSQNGWDDLWATLAPAERGKANDFRFEDPRRRFVIARGALRRLLGAYLGVPPADVELTSDPNGKPHLASGHDVTDLRFNVSHSGDLALVAIAAGCEIGIDVERVHKVGQMEQIARRFFHPAEAEAVLATPEAERNAAFLRCWTAKEAILKAIGTGITGSLANIQVPIGNSWQGWIELPGNLSTNETSRCWLQQLTPQDEYLAAIACVESQRLIRCFTTSL